MTDGRQKKFEDSLPQADKRLYSVNFLLADFAPMGNLQRGEQLRQNRLPSLYYQTRDLSIARFGKNISTPLSHFVPIDGEDE